MQTPEPPGCRCRRGAQLRCLKAQAATPGAAWAAGDEREQCFLCALTAASCRGLLPCVLACLADNCTDAAPRAPVQAAAPAGQAAGSGGGQQPQAVPRSQWLFEPKHGLPIVRKQLKCAARAAVPLSSARTARLRLLLYTTPEPARWQRAATQQAPCGGGAHADGRAAALRPGTASCCGRCGWARLKTCCSSTTST